MSRRGRPPLDAEDPDGSVSVNLRLPSRQYDALHAEARQQRVSVPELIRRRAHREPPVEKKEHERK
jgi:hypothetical protein